MKFSKKMFFSIILFAFCLTSCGQYSKSPPEKLEMVDANIVNGKSVTNKTVNAHSTVALVIEKNEGHALCTGSMIAPNFILTAAHCVDDHPKSIQIHFSYDVHKTKKENIRIADTYIQNTHWEKHLNSGEGDLAIIHFKVKGPSEYIPVNLFLDNTDLNIGQKIYLQGYGVTNGVSKVNSGKLRQTTSEIIGRHSDTELISDGSKSSVCFGDSGGPAFIKIKNKWFQWGVASSVSNQACNDTSIHTEVKNYASWINDTIKKMKTKNE